MDVLFNQMENVPAYDPRYFFGENPLSAFPWNTEAETIGMKIFSSKVIIVLTAILPLAVISASAARASFIEQASADNSGINGDPFAVIDDQPASLGRYETSAYDGIGRPRSGVAYGSADTIFNNFDLDAADTGTDIKLDVSDRLNRVDLQLQRTGDSGPNSNFPHMIDQFVLDTARDLIRETGIDVNAIKRIIAEQSPSKPGKGPYDTGVASLTDSDFSKSAYAPPGYTAVGSTLPGKIVMWIMNILHSDFLFQMLAIVFFIFISINAIIGMVNKKT